jgi:hypothetical protein
MNGKVAILPSEIEPQTSVCGILVSALGLVYLCRVLPNMVEFHFFFPFAVLPYRGTVGDHVDHGNGDTVWRVAEFRATDEVAGENDFIKVYSALIKILFLVNLSLKIVV